MANELVKALLVEIDGNVEKLRRELRKGEGDLQAFAGRASTAGKAAGAAADVTAQKQANAARAIASATETIARQGEVSGAAAKTLVAQASNAALFWGPKGAVVGAIGISVIAIVGLFTRVKREAAEAAAETRKEFEKMASMDLVSIARRRHEIEQGDLFLRERLGGDPSARAGARLEARDNFERLGREGLAEERDRLRALRDADNRIILANANRRLGQAAVPERANAADRAQVRADLEAVERALAKLDQLATRADAHIARTAKETGELAGSQLALAQDAERAKAAAEAKKDREQAQKELERETEQFAKDFESFLLATVGSSVDQVAARFDAMIERARRLAPGSGQDVQLGVLKDEAVATAKELERITALFNRLDLASAQGVAPVVDDFTDINAQLASARARLAHLKEGSDDYQKVLGDIIKLEERYRKLLKGVADAGGSDGNVPDPRDAADIAREIQQAADGALQLAQNLGGADESAIGLLRTIGQIAGNVPALVQALKAGSGLGIVSAALPILGALSSLVGANPEERRRADELRANTDAIRELTAKAGLLGGVGLSGSEASAASGQLRGFFRSAFGGRALVEGGARGEARRFGINLVELDRIAAAYGITLNDNIGSFRQLEAALADSITKLGEFGTDLESAQRQAEAEIQVFGVTDPLERLGIRQRATAGRSSALDALTAGLDLGTEEGRARARENAQGLFEILRAGGATLSSDALGSLTGDQLLQAILDLISSLDDVEQVVGGGGSTLGGVSGFRGLTEGAGNRLADYTRTLVGYSRESRDIQSNMLLTLQRIAGSPLTVPSLPGGVGAGGTFGGGGAVYHFTIELHQSFAFAEGDPERAATAVGRSVSRSVEDGIYRAIRQASIASGDLRIPRGSSS